MLNFMVLRGRNVKRILLKIIGICNEVTCKKCNIFNWDINNILKL